MQTSQRVRLGVFLFALLACAASAAAQIRSATITGTVTDSTGAVLPGAAVVVTNQDTNATTELLTTDAGVFTATYLPAGPYTVTVTLAGFSHVQADQHPGRDGADRPHRGRDEDQHRRRGRRGRRLDRPDPDRQHHRSKAR